jgi:hypothetical protein
MKWNKKILSDREPHVYWWTATAPPPLNNPRARITCRVALDVFGDGMQACVYVDDRLHSSEGQIETADQARDLCERMADRARKEAS